MPLRMAPPRWLRIVWPLAAALPGCSQASLEGTFTCTARVDLVHPDGKRESIDVPDDVVVVRSTARHYQAYEYDVTARGCVAKAEGDAKAASFGSRSSTCTLDVPRVGPIALQRVSGGISRERGEKLARDGLHLVLNSTTATDRFVMVTYTCQGQPR